jgi:murein DD-endopeptidase MepM/ murein hydrolase activator NlpD
VNQRALHLIFIAFALLICYGHVSAGGFQAEVYPREVRPGDPFLVQVTGIKSSRLISASLGKNKLLFNRCGKGCYLAIGAIDIKTEPGIYPVQLKAGKKKNILDLTVLETTFPKQELSLSEEKVFLDQKNLRRVKRENKRLKALFRKVSGKLWNGDFIFPLENEISTEFGTERLINHEITSVHSGVDISGEEGEEIMASNRGKVILKKELFFGGKTVIIDHGQGIYTIYMHLSKYNVRLHDIVPKGYVIGYVGSTGRATGPHLHFGVKISKINVNPISLFELEL